MSPAKLVWQLLLATWLALAVGEALLIAYLVYTGQPIQALCLAFVLLGCVHQVCLQWRGP